MLTNFSKTSSANLHAYLEQWRTCIHHIRYRIERSWTAVWNIHFDFSAQIKQKVLLEVDMEVSEMLFLWWACLLYRKLIRSCIHLASPPKDSLSLVLIVISSVKEKKPQLYMYLFPDVGLRDRASLTMQLLWSLCTCIVTVSSVEIKTINIWDFFKTSWLRHHDGTFLHYVHELYCWIHFQENASTFLRWLKG
jgi:hypothetical protein